MPRFYASLLPFVRVQLVEASDKVLAAFDDSLQQKALEALASKVIGSPPRRIVEVRQQGKKGKQKALFLKYTKFDKALNR